MTYMDDILDAVDWHLWTLQFPDLAKSAFRDWGHWTHWWIERPFEDFNYLYPIGGNL